MTTLPEWQGFQKIARFRREWIVTEKIDGTNAQVFVGEDGTVLAGSRNRWLTVEQDNFGFARWVADHADELRGLGPGRHFGEWWGAGIQRRYGLTEKRFSLFNVSRWGDDATRPPCCYVVPVLARDIDPGMAMATALLSLQGGSVAAPGSMNPEGLVLFHAASNALFKYTLDGDAAKGAA